MGGFFSGMGSCDPEMGVTIPVDADTSSIDAKIAATSGKLDAGKQKASDMEARVQTAIDGVMAKTKSAEELGREDAERLLAANGIAITKVRSDTETTKRIVDDEVERDRQRLLETGTLSTKTNAEIAADKARNHDILMETLGRADATKAKVDETVEEGKKKLGWLEDYTYSMKRHLMSHVFSAMHQVWSIIDKMFGISKTAAGKAIGFAISSFTSLISMASAATATYSAMGAVGIPFALASIAAGTMSVVSQAQAIAQQGAIEANTDRIGEIMIGNDY